jgi:hypothetical protein
MNSLPLRLRNAVAVMLAAQREQVEHQPDLGRIERTSLQDLETDAVAALGIDHPVVVAVDDHRAVIGRGQDGGEPRKTTDRFVPNWDRNLARLTSART